jgi:hypothetical protein
MLVTFKSNAYANITMFGDVAKKLIQSMGHSGAIPGAIQADDLPLALSRLKTTIQSEMMTNDDNKGNKAELAQESEDYVSIDKRALPLIALLEAAIAQNEDVMWEE